MQQVRLTTTGNWINVDSGIRAQLIAEVNHITPTMTTEDMKDRHYDDQQVKYMLEDLCVRVDPDDNVLGPETKKNCHLIANIEQGLLHRAFSIFLFDAQHRLVLQQRSLEKITFPQHWTNTVCSHPLFNDQAETNGVDGVILAAQRKLSQELGIPSAQAPIEGFKYLTRIHYKAPTDDMWGEHEVDYILFTVIDSPSIEPNPNEVMNTKLVTEEEVKQMLRDAEEGRVKITPWFRLIVEHFLLDWWKQLKAQGLSGLEMDQVIHRL
ncbi:hypothetical protein PROFUN_00640 [Planoprotostelium fungivorum]|uniref:isopentenyl-diphosphate Delta-isomerase n=1 Tax=Planoprotostelium fungivorum TaxID=1890364 RepID=A0A2P6NTY5_9EUKA|nr:hypothetical protein PROFUN_00640 [Planoprotostelium fungivorum]